MLRVSRRRSGASEGEAVVAVDGLAARGAEGDRCFLAAAGAGRREHLAGAAGIPAATAAVAVAGTASVAGAPPLSPRAALRLARQDEQRRGSVKPRSA